MSNAIFRKPDGLCFSVPPGSVYAILSNAGGDQSDGILSFIMTTISGSTSHPSGMSGDDVMEAIKAPSTKRRPTRKPSNVNLSRFDVGEDGSYLQLSQIEGYDEISPSQLNLFWRHSPEKPCIPVTVSNTEANRKLVDIKKEE